MRYAIKTAVRMQAWQLGRGSDMEREMIRQGRIKPLGDGRYEVFSLEATGARGEVALEGDYFKVDSGAGMPYPNAREGFESSHIPLGDDWYEYRARPLPIWMDGDPACEVVEWLLQTGRLRIHPDTPGRWYSARLWDTEETAPRDAVLVFYDIRRGADGAIEAVDFNFVVREAFERTYAILPEQRD